MGFCSEELGRIRCEAWCEEIVVSQSGQHYWIQHQDDERKESVAEDEDAIIRGS